MTKNWENQQLSEEELGKVQGGDNPPQQTIMTHCVSRPGKCTWTYSGDSVEKVAAAQKQHTANTQNDPQGAHTQFA